MWLVPAHLKGCGVTKPPRRPHGTGLLLPKKIPVILEPLLVLRFQTSLLTSICLAGTSALSWALFHLPLCSHSNQASATNLETTPRIFGGWFTDFAVKKLLILPYFLDFTACQAACSRCFVFNPGFTNISTGKCDIFIWKAPSRGSSARSKPWMFSVLRRGTKAIQTCRLELGVEWVVEWITLLF